MAITNSVTAQGPLPDLRLMTTAMRRWIILQSHASNVGHIGSALSIVDIMAVLWGGVLRNVSTSQPDRDRFILSKGHACLALYAALRYKGLLDELCFATYCTDGSPLGVHPEHALQGIDLSTGSLGQGLSVASGLAYGFRSKQLPSRVFALLSDAECNEGQVWEAAMFAGHHRLGNLVGIVDVNGTQALGHTRDVLDLEPLGAKWRAFGWNTVEVDGHNLEALIQVLRLPAGDAPRMVLARTVMGKGVAFMEDQVAWHYRTLTSEQAAIALSALTMVTGGEP